MTRRRGPLAKRAQNESGGATVELTILAPLLIMFLLLVVSLGRLTLAREAVDGAARDASRSASLERSPSSAMSSATATANASLQTEHASCRNADVSVDTSSFRPGGWVAVDVTCHVDLANLSLLRIPGTKDIHARFVSPVDLFRSAT